MMRIIYSDIKKRQPQPKDDDSEVDDSISQHSVHKKRQPCSKDDYNEDDDSIKMMYSNFNKRQPWPNDDDTSDDDRAEAGEKPQKTMMQTKSYA